MHETIAINKIVVSGVLDNVNNVEQFEALASDYFKDGSRIMYVCWYFIEEIITLFES